MAEVLILRGLPASGKTTYARQLVEQGYKRVNKDDLRAMLDNGKYTGSNESFVLKVRDHIIRRALIANMNVVVDDTNIEPMHVDRIRDLVEGQVALGTVQCDVRLVDIHTTVEECIRRDALRETPVGAEVIRRMAQRRIDLQYTERYPEA